MTQPKKPIQQILMTADTVGGVWTYALDLCKAMQAFDIEVCLATMGAPLSASQRLEAREIGNLDIRESTFKLEWMDNPWENVDKAGKWLLQLEREVEPDIIHLNGYTHAALNWNAPVVVVAHSCVLSWWQAVKNEDAPSEWNEYKHRVQRGLKAANAVVSISHSYAQQLKQIYGPLDNISVIYNGSDAAEFYSSNKKKQAFAMGRVWDEAKNLPILGKLDSAAQITIYLAGNNQHPSTNAQVEIPNVQVLGTLSRSEIKQHLAESFFYILPAKYEPFGLSALEAALSGCLLVLADIPTLKELWQNTALYFNPEKPEELDYKLKEALQHPEVCQVLVSRSSARAKLLSLETMANHYFNLYQSLAAKAVETESSAKKLMQVL